MKADIYRKVKVNARAYLLHGSLGFKTVQEVLIHDAVGVRAKAVWASMSIAVRAACTDCAEGASACSQHVFAPQLLSIPTRCTSQVCLSSCAHGQDHPLRCTSHCRAAS